MILRRVGVAGDDVPPPRIVVVVTRHRQHADDGVLAMDGLDHRADGGVPGHRRARAEVIARDVPIAGILRRDVDGDRERPFEGQGGADEDPPDGDQIAAGKGAAVAVDQAIDDLGFARRLDLDPPVLLDRAHLLDQLGPADQQVLDRGVDVVDVAADLVERSLHALRGFRNVVAEKRWGRYRRWLSHNGTVRRKQRKRCCRRGRLCRPRLAESALPASMITRSSLTSTELAQEFVLPGQRVIARAARAAAARLRRRAERLLRRLAGLRHAERRASPTPC